ncbi:MAG TPA: class I tRNA ligase family protein, partial [Nitrospiria bacterium]|nr:class I tRNA ligase family protein [Nitrospiria bacterium]
MDYKKTLNLPKTDFPMKANLTQREPLQLRKWDEENLYGSLLESKSSSPPYILHDGPPYANGKIHIGHALNKILKDFVVKSKSMEGYRTPFVPGWDCHGLPIEHQVLKNLGSKKAEKSRGEIRQLCREYAAKFIEIQKEEFKRLGVLGDWENPYLTMTPGYEADIIREFGKVVRTGAVYRAKKPVLWCAHDETALAEAEVDYEDHTSPSIFVKFRISGFGDGHTPAPDPEFILIWTTTPWTLPANQGVAVHPEEIYRLILVTKPGATESWILAETLLKSSMDKFGLAEGSDFTVDEERIPGREVCKRYTAYTHPFVEGRRGRILEADFVTMDQGTGCVHIAPGHGQEDYDLYRALGGEEGPLKIVAPVDSRGRFTEEAGLPELVGKKVFEANDDVIRVLKTSGALIKSEAIAHSFPHCWRCKKPVLFRATE